ncbi:MAG: hypothetical protein M3256_04225 [Actinomycetota bacterium]|nr:hypothetical protein [Actinomycetota bacterium]
MSESRRRSTRALLPEQVEERFDTAGLDFETALARVLAGGLDADDHKADDEREVDK